MRVLVIAACPVPWPRGTPIRVHRMSEALVERSHDVHLVTYALGDPCVRVSYTLHRTGMRGVRVSPRPGPSFTKLAVLDPLLTARARQLVRDGEFDVIHAHHYEGLIAALLARGRVPVPIVYDAHTLLASELPHYKLPLPRSVVERIGLELDSRLPARADHVIAVTERMRAWFTGPGTIPAERISLIPSGVEHEHFASTTAVARDAAHHVVFSGNLASYQRIDLLLDAFRAVRDVRPQARLTVITDGDHGSLDVAVRASGLAGAVTALRADYASLPAHLSGADVLVNPRTACDGIPQKLLNYMAAGRPIVSFSGSAALLEHDRTALIAEDGDTGAFARAVVRLLDEPQLGARLGAAAQRAVVASYGWSQLASRVEDIYRGLTGKPC